MPNKFSFRSQAKLDTCHKDLVLLFTTVLLERDCIIIEGHRSQGVQDEYQRTGKSQLRWPNSKHNSNPSMGIDVMEYFPTRPHIHWADLGACEDFALYVQTLAKTLPLDYALRWGGDWDGDGVRVDRDPNETFFDGAHYELREK